MKFRAWFALVKFSHSVFALPFALIGAWLAAGGMPRGRTFLWILLCTVAARTAALAFNRWIDRELDRANPRTASRELPQHVLAPQAVLALVLVSSAIFVLGAFALNEVCGWLALPVLGVLLGYSVVKRFSWLSHAVLGLALGLAPLGAWLAVRGNFEGDLLLPFSLSAAVLTWVAGFDLIYACQDVEFDRRAALHSIPARFGVRAALGISGALHALTLFLLVVVAVRAHLGPPFWAALGLAGILLAWQHALVSPRDLSRVNVAFFTLNGWIALGLFVGTVLDLDWRSAG